MSGFHSLLQRLRFLHLAVVFTGILSTGCAMRPLKPDNMPEPELLAIQEAFERTVEAAHNDPHINWVSGWMGNAMINLVGGNRKGKCFEWRNLVYDGVIPTVRRVGWDATGVVISKYTYSEHSAVVVFDPKYIGLDEILSAKENQPVYVLDAWRHGRAEIYPMQAWLRLPLIVRSPPQLKTLPVKPRKDVSASVTAAPAR